MFNFKSDFYEKKELECHRLNKIDSQGIFSLTKLCISDKFLSRESLYLTNLVNGWQK